MTHLRIELNTTGIEEVSGAVIAKLYDIVYSGTLDNTSNLLGRLHTTATYLTYIDYLEGLFDGTNNKGPLYIDATKKYLLFEDPEVERVFIAKNIGDGIGLTLSDVLSITTISYLDFYNNTELRTLNDLLYFTGLTSLQGRCVQGATNLTSVIFPSSVRELSRQEGDPAWMGVFRNCTSLTSVILNEGLLKIMARAFYNCTALTYIDLPSSLTLISADGVVSDENYNTGGSYGAFGLCSNLVTVTGGENITILGAATFITDFKLESLPDFDFSKITKIGSYCFADCSVLLLGNLNLSALILTKLEYATFYNCKGLTSVTLPNTLIEIAGIENWTSLGVFRGCTSLTTVNASGLLVIGDCAFMSCSALTSVDLSSVTRIGERAFYNCSALTSVDLSSVTFIGNQAFRGCTNLTTVTLPQSNVDMNGYVFYECTSLLSIDLSNVTLIKERNFYGTTNLSNVTLSLSLTLLDTLCFKNSGISGVINIPNVTKIYSEALTNTKITKIVTGSALTALESNAVSNCSYLLEIDLSASTNLTTIPGAAFSNTTATKVSIPSSVTYIEDWAFVPKDVNVSDNRSYYIYATTPPTLDATRCIISSNGTTPAAIYVPAGSVSDYLNASVWSNFASVILAMPST